MRKSVFAAALVLALSVFVVPALAGHNTYYKIKGGSATVKVSAAKELKNDYGITIAKRVGPLRLKRGGTVYSSSNTLRADFHSGAKIKLSYVTRRADGKKGATKHITIKRLNITVGAKRSMIVGRINGTELRIFNIDGGRLKKSRRAGVAYTFSSGKITFNSELTNLLNSYGTPIGTKHASAKVDLGSISVKVK